MGDDVWQRNRRESKACQDCRQGIPSCCVDGPDLILDSRNTSCLELHQQLFKNCDFTGNSAKSSHKHFPNNAHPFWGHLWGRDCCPMCILIMWKIHGVRLSSTL